MAQVSTDYSGANIAIGSTTYPTSYNNLITLVQNVAVQFNGIELEVSDARTTYPTLNDRLNAIAIGSADVIDLNAGAGTTEFETIQVGPANSVVSKNELSKHKLKIYHEEYTVITPVLGIATLDAALGNNFLINLTADTEIQISNINVGGTNMTPILLAVKQDIVGGHALIFSNTVFLWPNGVDELGGSAEPNNLSLFQFITLNGVEFLAHEAGINYKPV